MKPSTVFYAYVARTASTSTWSPSVAIWSWRLSGVHEKEGRGGRMRIEFKRSRVLKAAELLQIVSAPGR